MSTVALIVGIYAIVSVKAMEKSTHSVTYMPIDPEIDKANQEFSNSWATDDSEIEKQNKMWAKDLEENLPDFAPNDEDKKRFSL